MRALTHREKRAVLLAAAAVALYVLCFGGLRLWKALENQRAAYAQLLREAQNLRLEVKTYESKAEAVQKLMDTFKLDPAKLNKTNAVAEASAAIQKAAAAGGIAVGPVRESPGRPANKELATVQFEGTGPVPSVTALLSRLESVGYPLIIEAVQLTPMPGGQPMMKVNLTISILDFEQWKKGGVPHA
jgi:hypothetical protein